MAYSDEVIDHYENPRNVGSLPAADKQVGTGMVGAPACGDVMRLQIQVAADGRIEDAKFKTYGCGSARSPMPALLHQHQQGYRVEGVGRCPRAGMGSDKQYRPTS